MILCDGDSVTYGLQNGNTVTQTFTAQLAIMIASLYPGSTVLRYDGVYPAEDGHISGYGNAVTVQSGTNGQTIVVVKSGVGGDTVLRNLRRMADFTTKITDLNMIPDAIIIGLGINDAVSTNNQKYVTYTAFQNGLKTLIRQVRLRTNADVVLMTCPTWFGDNQGNDYVAAYCQAIKNVAFEEAVGLIDVHNNVFVKNYVIGASNNGMTSWLGADGLHPLAIAHKAIATEIFRVLFANQPYMIQSESVKSYERFTIPYNSPSCLYAGGGDWINPHGINYNEIVINEALATSGNCSVTIKVRASDIYILTRLMNVFGYLYYTIDGGAEQAINVLRNEPTDKSDVSDSSSTCYPSERILLAKNLSDDVHTVLIYSKGGYFAFFGLEVVRIVDRAAIITAPGLHASIIQSGNPTITGSGAATKTLTVTFNQVHGSVPVVVATTSDYNYVVAVNTITRTSMQLVLSRKDGTTFSSSIPVTWISLG